MEKVTAPTVNKTGKNLEKKEILTVKEFCELPEGTPIHFWLVDRGGNLMENRFLLLGDIEPLSVTEKKYYHQRRYDTKLAFMFTIDKFYKETSLIEDMEFNDTGWSFTIRRAVEV